MLLEHTTDRVGQSQNKVRGNGRGTDDAANAISTKIGSTHECPELCDEGDEIGSFYGAENLERLHSLPHIMHAHDGRPALYSQQGRGHARHHAWVRHIGAGRRRQIQ